jgi:hypothetical protein
VVEKEFADRDEVKKYIINTQLGRRNLSTAAESYLRGKRYLETKKRGPAPTSLLVKLTRRQPQRNWRRNSRSGRRPSVVTPVLPRP